MGKKGTKRKTRWRVLPIGTEEGGSGSGNDDDDLGSYSRATQKPRPQGRTHSGTNGGGGGGGGGGGYYNNKQYYHPRPYGNHETGQPLVTTEKQIFNEEEYTKITTPRQDVLFKKGYLGRKRPVVAVPAPEPGHVDDSVEDGGDVEGNEMLDDQPQYIYTNGFMDQTGVYYINGSGYEMFDPYTGQVAVLVGPHYGHPGGPPPLLAAVSCQPVPLQPLEWFNPPGFLPFVQAPCQGPGVPGRDRVKRYSTDSQNCSPVSSESTGPPGSPQESDETGRGVVEQCAPSTPGAPPQLPLVFPHPPPTYVYPGYMFGAPMFNVNGVTVQTTPNQAPSADVTGKRRKKKRKRRRKVNGEGDASEESSSEGCDDKDEASRRDSPSQESSLESDSKLSLSSEEPPYVPAVDGVSALNPRAVDFTSTAAPKSDGLNVHVDEFEVKPVADEVDHSKTNGTCVETSEVDPVSVDDRLVLNDERETKKNDTDDKSVEKTADKEVTHSKSNGICVKSNVNGFESSLNEKDSLKNNKLGSKSFRNDNEVVAVHLAKLDFAAAVTPKVNGHAPPQAVVAVVDDAAFERYEDFEHVNGFTNGDVEDEWITVKPKTRKSEASNGHQEKKETGGGGGHAKPFRQTNGRGLKQEPRLYKTNDKHAVKPLYKVNGKMDGHEKERKTSSSSSEGKPETPPVKPTRRERKNKSQSPPQTPEVPVGMATIARPPCVVDFVVKEALCTSSSAKHQEAEILPAIVVKNTGSLIAERNVEKQKESVLESVPPGNASPAVPTSSDSAKQIVQEVELSGAEKTIASEELTLSTTSVDCSDVLTDAVVVVETKTVPEEVQPIVSQPTPGQPMASHLTQSQPMASHLTQSQPIASHLTPSQPMASHLTPSQPMASQPTPGQPMASHLTQSQPMASHLTQSQPMASHLTQSLPMASHPTPSQPIASEPPSAKAPVPPPRRKKYRPPSQRLPDRAATPGQCSDSDSSSSPESEASVIECLALDRSDQSGLSSSDEEVIYSGKLGVEQPQIVGKMTVPRNTWAATSKTSTAKSETRATAPSRPEQVLELATEIVDSVIERAVGETSKSRHPNLGITDAVTRWLRSQSPDVLSPADNMADIAEVTEDEEDDDDDGPKNLQRNPLPAPSVSGGKRVANKTAETSGDECAEMEPRDFHDAELEWDTWDLLPAAERRRENAYDPGTSDSYQVVDNRAMTTPDLPLEVCPKLYDANLSVAKYYNLAETASPWEHSGESEPEDGYRVSLATELARLQQPLPPTWKVAPLVVKSEVDDSGVESGDDVVVKKPSVFKRKLIGRLKGEGGPFPCGGVCCIVQ